MSCSTTGNFVRVQVRVRVWVRVAWAKYVGKNVVGHNVVGQDNGNPPFNLKFDYNLS